MDDVHRARHDETDEVRENAAVADDSSSDEQGEPGEATEPVAAAVAGDALPSVGADSGDLVPAHPDAVLSADQAEAVQAIKTTTAALQDAIEGLSATGALKAKQCLEDELAKQRRRARQFVNVSPAVADAFSQRRRAETQEMLRRKASQ